MKGNIYKIESKDESIEGDIYIGSTMKEDINDRLKTHIYQYKHYIRHGFKDNYMNSFILFEKYGVDNVKITLLNSVEVDTRKELLIYETSYIKSLQNVNKHVSYLAPGEHKIYLQKYYLKNKEKYHKYYLETTKIKNFLEKIQLKNKIPIKKINSDILVYI